MPYVNPETAQQRFWPKVNKDGPVPEYRPDLGACWHWTASVSRDGGGQLYVGHRNRRAYQLSYEWLVGPVPAGLELDHLCRNRRCVNPAHLEPITHAENIRRGLPAMQRSHCPRGHALAGENLYIAPRGNRACRICRDASVRRHVARTAETRCSIADCHRGVKAIGLCPAHWYRQHRYGDPLAGQAVRAR